MSYLGVHYGCRICRFDRFHQASDPAEEAGGTSPEMVRRRVEDGISPHRMDYGTRRFQSSSEGRCICLAGDQRLTLDFLVQAATTFISSLAYFPVSLYLPTYTVSLLSSDDAFKPNLVVGIFNLAAMAGSNVTGYASDFALSWTVSAIGVAGGVVALGAWGTASSLGKVFGFAVLFGFNSQICSCWGPAARDAAGEYCCLRSTPAAFTSLMSFLVNYVGANPQTSTTIFCLFGIVRGVASLVGPFVSTSLYDKREAESKECVDLHSLF